MLHCAELSATKSTKAKSAGVQKKRKRQSPAAFENFGVLAQSLEKAAKFDLKKKNTRGHAVKTLRARENIA